MGGEGRPLDVDRNPTRLLEGPSAWLRLLTDEQRTAAMGRVARRRAEKAADAGLFEAYARTLFDVLVTEVADDDARPLAA